MGVMHQYLFESSNDLSSKCDCYNNICEPM